MSIDWPFYAHVSNVAVQTQVLNSQTYKETHGFVYLGEEGRNKHCTMWYSQETLVTCVQLSSVLSSEAFYKVISGSPAL